MSKRDPTLTCLVQTFRNNLAEQLVQIRDALEETPGVNLISSERVLGNFGLLLKLQGSLENLLRAVERLRSLLFIQHIATFLSPSEEIVPDKIGKSKVKKEAKAEVIEYLTRSQGTIVRDIEDMRKQIDAILVQSERGLAPGSREVTAVNVREAISQIHTEHLFRRVDNLETRLRALEYSFGVGEGRRLQASESQTFSLQRTQATLKKRHVAILMLALLLSLASLALDVYAVFFV